MMGDPPMGIREAVIEYGDPNPLETLRREFVRQFVRDQLERERVELAHLAQYPDAITYGRHVPAAWPLIKDVHQNHVGGEYVGRHRRPKASKLDRGTVYYCEPTWFRIDPDDPACYPDERINPR